MFLVNRPKRPILARPGLLLLALVIILAIGWVHRAFFSNDGIALTSAEAPRIVVVGAEDALSTFGELRGTLVTGELPGGAHEAEVLSDRDCAPDTDGVSHCLNELALGSTRLTIRHRHRMSQVPCLRPGETVTLMDAATYTARHSS